MAQMNQMDQMNDAGNNEIPVEYIDIGRFGFGRVPRQNLALKPPTTNQFYPGVYNSTSRAMYTPGVVFRYKVGKTETNEER